jgi:hypothetical protein
MIAQTAHLHPGGDKAGQVQARIPIQKQLIMNDLVSSIFGGLVLRHPVSAKTLTKQLNKLIKPMAFESAFSNRCFIKKSNAGWLDLKRAEPQKQQGYSQERGRLSIEDSLGQVVPHIAGSKDR